ncbi:putative sodium-dependent transporter HI_0736 [Glandiceps talaboti]
MSATETTPLNQRRQSKVGSGENNGGRGQFRSTISMVLALTGCVVGTGNIWRYPRIVANNSGEGGALHFLIIWFIFLFLWSVPMMLIEYATGRFTKVCVVESYKKLLSPLTMWGGAVIVIATLGISSYYCTLCGWSLYYFYHFTFYSLPETEEESFDIFNEFTEEGNWPLFTTFLADLIASVSVLWSVRSIEIANSILVPIFLLLLLFNFIWSMTLPYACLGLKFLFSPDWKLLKDPVTWMDAISQNAWDTGVGHGEFLSYANHMTPDNGVVILSLGIPCINNFVSLLNGMTTFASVFAIEVADDKNITEIVKILKSNGPGNTGLTFIWIPMLYSTIGTTGKYLAMGFFLATAFAGISSLIAHLELYTKTLEDFGLPRKPGVILSSVVVFLLNIGSSMNVDFLVIMDYVWSYGLIISGLLLQYLVISYGTSKYRSELVNDYGTNDWYLPKAWEWFIKFIAPVEAIAILLWFLIDEIIYTDGWYQLAGGTTIMNLFLQWSIVIAFLVGSNLVYVCVWLPRRSQGYNEIQIPESEDTSPLTETSPDKETGSL